MSTQQPRKRQSGDFTHPSLYNSPQKHIINHHGYDNHRSEEEDEVDEEVFHVSKRHRHLVKEDKNTTTATNSSTDSNVTSLFYKPQQLVQLIASRVFLLFGACGSKKKNRPKVTHNKKNKKSPRSLRGLAISDGEEEDEVDLDYMTLGQGQYLSSDSVRCGGDDDDDGCDDDVNSVSDSSSTYTRSNYSDMMTDISQTMSEYEYDDEQGESDDYLGDGFDDDCISNSALSHSELSDGDMSEETEEEEELSDDEELSDEEMSEEEELDDDGFEYQEQVSDDDEEVDDIEEELDNDLEEGEGDHEDESDFTDVLEYESELSEVEEDTIGNNKDDENDEKDQNNGQNDENCQNTDEKETTSMNDDHHPTLSPLPLPNITLSSHSPASSVENYTTNKASATLPMGTPPPTFAQRRERFFSSTTFTPIKAHYNLPNHNKNGSPHPIKILRQSIDLSSPTMTDADLVDTINEEENDQNDQNDENDDMITLNLLLDKSEKIETVQLKSSWTIYQAFTDPSSPLFVNSHKIFPDNLYRVGFLPQSQVPNAHKDPNGPKTLLFHVFTKPPQVGYSSNKPAVIPSINNQKMTIGELLDELHVTTTKVVNDQGNVVQQGQCRLRWDVYA